jgi:hypothetical protein
MPNDAKLGLLAGVLGVVIAATISGGKPPPPLGIASGPASATSSQPAPPTKVQSKSNEAPTTTIASGIPAGTPAVSTKQNNHRCNSDE